jgi:hypothetical protein
MMIQVTILTATVLVKGFLGILVPKEISHMALTSAKPKIHKVVAR